MTRSDIIMLAVICFIGAALMTLFSQQRLIALPLNFAAIFVIALLIRLMVGKRQ